MNLFKRNVLAFSFIACSGFVFSQEDLLSLVDDKKAEAPKKVYATFKTVRIGNVMRPSTKQ